MLRVQVKICSKTSCSAKRINSYRHFPLPAVVAVNPLRRGGGGLRTAYDEVCTKMANSAAGPYGPGAHNQVPSVSHREGL